LIIIVIIIIICVYVYIRDNLEMIRWNQMVSKYSVIIHKLK